MSKRLDTSLESEAAEFFVLGQLLLRRVQCFKAYTNFPGFDLIAVSEDGQRSKRIQVKSRWQTNYNGFPIKNFESDFVVLVALNRGFRPTRKTGDGVRDPDYYIFPTEYIQAIPKTAGWSKVRRTALDLDHYQNRWDLIIDSLK